VPADRLTWHYYWTRCFSVNRSKVTALQNMSNAGSMSAEREFAAQMARNGVVREVRNVSAGDLSGALRIAAMFGGMGAAAAGFALGTAESSSVAERIRRARRARATGRPPAGQRSKSDPLSPEGYTG
jgi:hypothetical protein